MKKFIILFMIIHIFSYANYLISNSEVVLFYDKNYNSVHYIRGDIFQGIDVSRIEGKLIVDGKKVIAINQYFESATQVYQTNILKLNYNIDGQYLTIKIVPSMLEKDKLYFIVEFINFMDKDKRVDFAFKIAPQYDNKYVEYNESKDSYNYDKFYFKSENYRGKTYIARDSVIEDLTLEKIDNKSKKYQDDNLYYIIEDIDYKKPIEFAIKFYKDFDRKELREGSEVLAQEIEYWDKVNSSIKFLDRRRGFFNQLKNLEIMTSRIIIPNQISYNVSEESLNTKVKLYYLSSIYDKNFNPNKFLEDLYSKKSENQEVVYYTFLFKYLNRSGNYLAENILNEKVMPDILKILGYLKEDNEEILNIRDNINNYYWYYELIKSIEDRPEFANNRELILEKKKVLLEYINKYYVREDGLKIRKDSEDSYYKNIKFIDFLPKDEQLKLLKADYKKYYNRLYGILKGKDEKRIDLSYNLNFIIKLYQNEERELADILFANLENYIKRNEYYLIPEVYPDRTNPAGIYGESLYLYFVATEYKERYGD